MANDLGRAGEILSATPKLAWIEYHLTGSAARLVALWSGESKCLRQIKFARSSGALESILSRLTSRCVTARQLGARLRQQPPPV